MSDFDKEAEREKLREKYERDKEQREATEQMSELLLKGATMTNAHCGTCGDPIFRYDGQEFCPTCEEVVTDGEAAEGSADGTGAAAAADPDGTTASATDAPATDATGETPDDATDPSTDAPTPDAGAADASAPETGGDATETGATTAAPADRNVPSADPDRSRDDTTSRVSTAPETVAGADAPLDTARVSLTRTVTKLAREAEESDDLERIRAYLAATEEAADALAAVKRADR
jgi:uncharacterized Zn finger protein (UPF0148 family)